MHAAEPSSCCGTPRASGDGQATPDPVYLPRPTSTTSSRRLWGAVTSPPISKPVRSSSSAQDGDRRRQMASPRTGTRFGKTRLGRGRSTPMWRTATRPAGRPLRGLQRAQGPEQAAALNVRPDDLRLWWMSTVTSMLDDRSGPGQPRGVPADGDQARRRVGPGGGTCPRMTSQRAALDRWRRS
jgi:hypothetical protein